jgi:hypothetical protein
MKKIFTFSFLLLLGISLRAQNSFSILDPDNSNADITNFVVDVDVDPSVDYVKELVVKNNLSSAKYVRLKRTFVSGVGTSSPDYDTLIMCWNLCLSANWNTVQTAGTINITSGGVASYAVNGTGYHVTFKPSNQIGTRVVRYTFYDNNNTADSVTVTYNYHIGQTGITESNIKLFNFSNPQPNPSNGITSIKYDFPNAAKAKIKIYNAVGTMVKEVKIEDQSGKVTLATDELSNGIYFYSLLVNDKVVGTKRLIVAQ